VEGVTQLGQYGHDGEGHRKHDEESLDVANVTTL
jgi:hypothetical protein